MRTHLAHLCSVRKNASWVDSFCISIWTEKSDPPHISAGLWARGSVGFFFLI